MITPALARDRVARGAALLDQHLPGWDRRIDLDTLVMMEACGCVVGQLFAHRTDRPAYGRYGAGIRTLFALPGDSDDDDDHAQRSRRLDMEVGCGFEIDRTYRQSDNRTRHLAFEALQAAWTALILERRS